MKKKNAETANKGTRREIYQSIPLFSQLTEEQLNEVDSLARLCKFRKNSTIFSEGDKYEGFYLLLKGAVKAYRITEDGKESIIHLIKPYDAFGELPMFEGNPYPINAQATAESSALFFPKNEFLSLMEANRRICLNMLAGFARRLLHLTRKIEDLTSREAVNRFASYLIEELKKSGGEKKKEPFVKLTVSKKIIAGYIGTVTETFSRILKKLQDEKIILVEGKTIYITDLPRLRSLAK